MLTIYPNNGWDSFVTVADADDFISTLTITSASWLALVESDKEIYLRIATDTILFGIDLDTYPLEDPITECLPQATALIAHHDVINGISANAAEVNTGEVKSQKVGTLKVEYFESAGGVRSPSWIPRAAYDCLESINYVFASTSTKFGQKTLGRS